MKTPIYTGLLQSDIDFAGFKPLNADLSDYDLGGGDGGGGGGGLPPGWVNVKEAPYNAVGDGVADDTTAINNAMAAVVAAGGGTVFFPLGIYLCNGAFDTTFKSILKIPYVNPVTSSPLTLELLGATVPAWQNYVTAGPMNFMFNSTIKTTRTDGMTADSNGFAAIIAGNSPLGNAPELSGTTRNAVMVRIRNMTFICPDNPTMGGVRLDAVSNAFVEDVTVNAGGIRLAGDGGLEPTHGTTGLWMPGSTIWGANWTNNAVVTNFDTGIKVGEHWRAPSILVFACKNGVTFLQGVYPSWANIIATNCVESVRFYGWHPVDLLLETEHSPFGDWTTQLHEVKDPNNYGMGVIRYYIGNNGGGGVTQTLSVDGGTGLTFIDLCSGNIQQNITYGASGGPGHFTRNLYIGTDLRLVPIAGGGKLQARNTSLDTWADVDQWTNP